MILLLVYFSFFIHLMTSQTEFINTNGSIYINGSIYTNSSINTNSSIYTNSSVQFQRLHLEVWGVIEHPMKCQDIVAIQFCNVQQSFSCFGGIDPAFINQNSIDILTSGANNLIHISGEQITWSLTYLSYDNKNNTFLQNCNITGMNSINVCENEFRLPLVGQFKGNFYYVQWENSIQYIYENNTVWNITIENVTSIYYEYITVHPGDAEAPTGMQKSHSDTGYKASVGVLSGITAILLVLFGYQNRKRIQQLCCRKKPDNNNVDSGSIQGPPQGQPHYSEPPNWLQKDKCQQVDLPYIGQTKGVMTEYPPLGSTICINHGYFEEVNIIKKAPVTPVTATSTTPTSTNNRMSTIYLQEQHTNQIDEGLANGTIGRESIDGASMIGGTTTSVGGGASIGGGATTSVRGGATASVGGGTSVGGGASIGGGPTTSIRGGATASVGGGTSVGGGASIGGGATTSIRGGATASIGGGATTFKTPERPSQPAPVPQVVLRNIGAGVKPMIPMSQNDDSSEDERSSSTSTDSADTAVAKSPAKNRQGSTSSTSSTN